MAPIFGVIPDERPTLLAWSELTFISMLKACFFFKAFKDNSEIRMPCGDEIKSYHFRIGVDTVFLSTCSTFSTQLNGRSIKEENWMCIIDQMGTAALLISHCFVFELFISSVWLSVITCSRTERLFLCYWTSSHGWPSLPRLLCRLVLSSLVSVLSRYSSAIGIAVESTSKKCRQKRDKNLFQWD